MPDPTCQGKPWVKPITTQDAYLLSYQLIDLQGQAADSDGIATAQPPPGAPPAGHSGAGRPAVLSALASSVTGTRPGTRRLPSVRQLRTLGERLQATAAGTGSKAIAVGSEADGPAGPER